MVETMGFTTGRQVLLRMCPVYDVSVKKSVFEQMKDYVGFSGQDEENVLALREAVRPFLAAVTARFYEEITQHEATRRVFTDDAQIVRLHRSFEKWLSELFVGRYDDDYFERRTAIGRAHSNINLPQHFMVGAMAVVWQSLERSIIDAGVPDGDVKARSLHKLLMLELAVMLDTYKERYATLIRDEERLAVEEKLTQAEHLAQIGQLAASLAHEIKNPLAGISGAIQVIRGGMSSDDARVPILGEVLTQINRLDSTVKDLLIYARPKPPKFSTCCINHVLDRVLRVLDEEPALQHIRFERNRCCEAKKVVADPAQLEQLAFNLLLNAAQASTDGSVVRVRTAQEGRWARLVIQDFGCGMDPATRDRAFEPFYTTKAKGTGLGLPICKKIVEAHGGRIRLVSVVNEGSQVIVEFPACTAETRGIESC